MRWIRARAAGSILRSLLLLAVISAAMFTWTSQHLLAGTAPNIDENLLGTLDGGALTIHGHNLGDKASAARAVHIDSGPGSVTVDSTSSYVLSWQPEQIELVLPQQALSGALTVTVDGVESQPVKLRVYHYSSFAIPPSLGTNKFGLTLDVGPDGKVWLNQEFHLELKSFDPALGTFMARTFPQAPGGGIFATTLFGNYRSRMSGMGEDVDTDGDGNVWFTEGGEMLYPEGGPYFNTSRIVRYHPDTDTFDCYNAPVDNAQAIGVLVDPARNMVWYTEGGPAHGAAITGFSPDSITSDCRFDPYQGSKRDALCSATVTVSCHQRFPLPNAFSIPSHLVLDPEGNIWFAEFFGNKIGRLSPETGEILELPLPAPIADQGPGQILGSSGPWEMAADDNGDVWATEFFDATVIRIHPSLMQTNDCLHLDANGLNPCVEDMTVQYDDDVEKVIHTVAVGAEGLVWFGVEEVPGPANGWTPGAHIGFMSSNGGQPVLLPQLDGLARPGGIAQDLRTHDVWFVEAQGQRVGRLQELGWGDADGDGFSDLIDTCVLVPNESQQDGDMDGLGNECDPDQCPDFDHDGVITINDILIPVRHYHAAKPDGGLYGIGDILQAMARYQSRCERA